jgi:hypothetical protein
MKMIKCLRRVVWLVFLILTFTLMSKAFAATFIVRSGNSNQYNSGVMDTFTGTFETAGCSVEVMTLGANAQYDPPGTGDDQRLFVGKIASVPPMGKFSIANVPLNNGQLLYVRVWNSATPETATKYGTSETFTVVDPGGAPPANYGYDVGPGATWGAGSPASPYGSDLPALYVNMVISAATPKITSVSPSTVKLNDIITIEGLNFGTGEGTDKVSIEGISIGYSSCLSWEATIIRVLVTAAMTAGTNVPVTVVVGSQSTTDSTLDIDPYVSSTSSLSNLIIGVTKVSFTGGGFGYPRATSSTADFKGISSESYPIWTVSSLDAITPSRATDGSVSIEVSGRVSSSYPYTTATPEIAGIAPSTNKIGGSSIISGNKFGTVEAGRRSDAATNNVTLGNNQLAISDFVNWQNNEITITVPTSIVTAGVYAVTVEAGNKATSDAVTLTVTPDITSITSAAPPNFYIGNTSININGHAFGSSLGSSTVTIEGYSLESLGGFNPSGTLITGTLPITIDAGSRTVEVTINGYKTTAQVICQPYISSLSTTEGKGGDVVTIYGYGYSSSLGTVKFNGYSVSNYRRWTSTSIEVEVPADATSGPVTVESKGQQSNGKQFNTSIVPTIIQIIPTTGSTKTKVTIVGSNFGAPRVTQIVTFEGAVVVDPTGYLGWSNTIVTVEAPAGGSTGNVYVYSGANISNGVQFTYLTPEVTGIIPNKGHISTIASINGTKFGTVEVDKRSTNVNNVKFGPSQLADGSINDWLNGSITISIPVSIATAGAYPVIVKAGGNTTAEVIFTVTPEITSVSAGPYRIGNTSITITGKAFGNVKGISSAEVGGKGLSSISPWNSTTITGTISTDVTAGAQNVQVTVSGEVSNPISINCTPYISGLIPLGGNPLTWVVINGFGFQGDSVVRFNSSPAAGYSYHSSTSAEAMVPSGATTGPVTVESASQPSNGVSFTVSTPGISTCTPARYKGDTGTFVTVVGSNTNFEQGLTTAEISGSQVAVGTVEVTGLLNAKVYINSISADATGNRNITLRTGLETATGTGLFVISTPEVSSLGTPSGLQGAMVTSTVYGLGTHFNGLTTVTFIGGAGVTGELESWTGPTTAEINIYIAGTAATGSRNISMITDLGAVGTENAGKTAAFTVYGGGVSNPPSITNLRFNGRPYYYGNVVSSRPILTAVVTAAGIELIEESYCSVEVDYIPIETSFTYAQIPGYIGNPLDRLMTINFITPLPAQPVGSHPVRVKVQSLGGALATWEGNVVVMSGAVQMVGPAYNYRNPFKPLSGDPGWNTTNIMYNLNVEATITIIIYDLTGQEVYRNTFGAGTEGGRAGINQVAWNGRSIFGDVVGNGMYLYKIISGNKVIGSGKLVVLD